MNPLDQVWTVSELAAATGRSEATVLQWVKRTMDELSTADRATFARQTTGARGPWLVNRQHPLVQIYVGTRTSHPHIAPKERHS